MLTVPADQFLDEIIGDIFGVENVDIIAKAEMGNATTVMGFMVAMSDYIDYTDRDEIGNMGIYQNDAGTYYVDSIGRIVILDTDRLETEEGMVDAVLDLYDHLISPDGIPEEQARDVDIKIRPEELTIHPEWKNIDDIDIEIIEENL